MTSFPKAMTISWNAWILIHDSVNTSNLYFKIDAGMVHIATVRSCM